VPRVDPAQPSGPNPGVPIIVKAVLSQTMSGLRELAAARWPWRGTGAGPLSGLLLALTVVTGMVDAVSYIALGHVFVANMTGNVVFLAFAAAGVGGLSITASLAAIAAFVLGALIGGRAGVRLGAPRGRYLGAVAGLGALLAALATVAAVVAGQPVSSGARFALIVPLAMATGAQNAMARRLAVSDLTTTVLTLTITGIAADSHLAGGGGGHPARRLLSVAAMFSGALLSALLVLHVDLIAPLAIVTALLAATALVAHRVSAGEPPWAKPPVSRRLAER
jgi:uncharacterized membrane protein YoaK (UPF0700 family)